MYNNKFVDATSLAEAYASLEKEFTKKCQELAKVKAELNSLREGDFSALPAQNSLLNKEKANLCADAIGARLADGNSLNKETGKEPVISGAEDKALKQEFCTDPAEIGDARAEKLPNKDLETQKMELIEKLLISVSTKTGEMPKVIAGGSSSPLKAHKPKFDSLYSAGTYLKKLLKN